MPIAQPKPLKDTPVQPEPVQAQKTKYLGIAADNHEQPIEQMVAYLDGMPWTVNWYRQLIGKHSNLQELDSGLNAAQQQYECIKGIELRVQSSLQPSYDQEQAITTVSGSAINPYLPPNKMDYFVAEAGTKQIGLYVVKSVERRTFNRGSVYLVDYELVAYVDNSSELLLNLTAKTVRTYYFSKERLVQGLAPILREEDFQAAMNFEAAYNQIVQQFFRTFFARSQLTLLVPGQSRAIYDAWIVEFVRAIVESDEAPELRELKQISLDRETYMAQGSLWTVLLDRRYDDLQRIHQKATVVCRLHFNRSSWLRGPVYWAIDQYVYPVLSDDDKVFPTEDPGLIIREPVSFQFKKDLTDPAYAHDVFTLSDGTVVPLAYSVAVDDYYVLSRNFYLGTPQQSVLELLVRDYLKSQTLDRTMLAEVVRVYPTWPYLERFYYGPLLLLLLRDVARGVY